MLFQEPTVSNIRFRWMPTVSNTYLQQVGHSLLGFVVVDRRCPKFGHIGHVCCFFRTNHLRSPFGTLTRWLFFPNQPSLFTIRYIGHVGCFFRPMVLQRIGPVVDTQPTVFVFLRLLTMPHGLKFPTDGSDSKPFSEPLRTGTVLGTVINGNRYLEMFLPCVLCVE